MKKMTLDVDALRVESFQTADASGGRGTVRAHDGACTVAPEGTCVKTCGNIPACTEDVCRGGAITFNACCV